MSINPYQAPADYGQVVGVNSGRIEDLRGVARYQKGILTCILIYLIAMLCQFLLPPELRLLLAAVVLLVGVAGTVCVFLLATKVYSTPLGILMGILTFLPCIGLIVLLIVNGKATSVLRQNGIKVGMLGADVSRIGPSS